MLPKALALLLALAATPAFAAAGGRPLVIAHEGYLLTTNDQPVSDSALAVTFRLFDKGVADPAAEVLQWEASCPVKVSNGFYGAILGEGACAGNVTVGSPDAVLDTADIPIDKARWLEVSVGGVTLAPRLRIGISPISAVASLALDADKLGGLAREGFLEKTQDLAGAKYGAGNLSAELDARAASVNTANHAFGGTNSFQQAVTFQGVSGSTTIDGGALTSQLVKTSSLEVGGGTLLLKGGAKVGIGVDAPAQALEVAGTVVATLFNGSGAGLTDLGSATVGAGQTLTALLATKLESVTAITGGGLLVQSGTQLGLRNDDPLSLGKVSANTLVSVGGKIGVGVPSPVAMLDVAGSIGATGDIGSTVADGFSVTNAALTYAVARKLTGGPLERDQVTLRRTAGNAYDVAIIDGNTYGDFRASLDFKVISPAADLHLGFCFDVDPLVAGYDRVVLRTTDNGVRVDAEGGTGEGSAGVDGVIRATGIDFDLGWHHVVVERAGTNVIVEVDGRRFIDGPIVPTRATGRVGLSVYEAGKSVTFANVMVVPYTPRANPKPFIKLAMSDYQDVDNNTTVAFVGVVSSNLLGISGNGVKLKAGRTYRLEARLNTYVPAPGGYLGYMFAADGVFFGQGAYSQSPGGSVTFGFNAGLLEFYTPSADVVVTVRINDDSVGTGKVTPSYNTYLAATEL